MGLALFDRVRKELELGQHQVKSVIFSDAKDEVYKLR